MKKMIKTLLMLTCVFMLTACSSAVAESEHQKNKIDQAQQRATNAVQLMTALVSASDVDVMLADYDNIELGVLFESTYIQYYGDNSFQCEGKAVRGALTSFKSGLEAMGSIEPGEPTASVDGDTIVVMVPVGKGSVELIFTNDIFMKMKSCTLNLDKTMGELMTNAVLNTVLGMGTVFAVLILISAIISAFGMVSKVQTSSASQKAEPAPRPAPVIEPVVADEEEELSDDTELVAVIAAAIAAYEGTSVDGFRVRSIKRSNATNKWKKAI